MILVKPARARTEAIESGAPHTTIRSKAPGEKSVCSRLSSPPCQYTIDRCWVIGWRGAATAAASANKPPGKTAPDGSFNTHDDLVQTARRSERIGTSGELPAVMWSWRVGIARTKALSDGSSFVNASGRMLAPTTCTGPGTRVA